MEDNEFKDNSSKREKKRDEWISIYVYLGIYKELRTYSNMSEVTLHKYQLNLSLVWYKYTIREHKRFVLDKFNYVHLLCSYTA